MSYMIIKSVKVEDDKVFVKSASNNVFPKTYCQEECKSLSKILQEKGRQELDIEVMREYEQGNFQAGNKNRYTRALEVLRHMPEYKKFDWKCNWEESQKNKENEKEYKALLVRALNTMLPKEKYLISKEVDGKMAYFYKRANARFCRWYYEKERAKLFNFREDAEEVKKWFTGSDSWEVVKA